MNATLNLVTGAGSKSASLTGTGVASTATLTITPSPSWSYGIVGKCLVDFKTFVLNNTSAITATGLSTSAMATGGSSPGNYDVGSSTCGATLAGLSSCTLEVAFAADNAGGTSSGRLTVAGTNFATQQVTLSATTDAASICQ